jgi:ABC-type branched-subunit amino acid transport system substrate-binding protein
MKDNNRPVYTYGGRPSRTRIGVLGALALSVVLVACGSSGKSTSGTTAAGGGSTPSKAPVLVYNISADSGLQAEPTFAQVLNAEVDSVNAGGGIAGHPVKLVNCDDQGSANVDTQCAIKAASAHAMVVLNNLGVGSSIVPELAQAKIPVVAFFLGYPIEGTSPYSFPLQGDVSYYTGMGQEMAVQGCKHPGVLYNTGEGGDGIIGPLDASFQANGIPFAKYVAVDPTAASPAAPVATLLSEGVDCVAQIAGLGTDGVSATEAVRTQAPNVKVFVTSGTISTQTLSQFGALANGIFVSAAEYTNFDTQVPAIQNMITTVQHYSPGLTLNGYDTDVWAGLEIALAGAKGVIAKNQALTGPNEVVALDSLKDFPTGILAPTTFTAAGSGLPLQPRLFNFGAVWWKIEGGKLTPLTKTFVILPQSREAIAAGYMNKLPG